MARFDSVVSTTLAMQPQTREQLIERFVLLLQGIVELANRSGCATLADFIASPGIAQRDALLQGLAGRFAVGRHAA